MNAPSEDPSPALVGSLLDALEQATSRLSTSLTRVSVRDLAGPSLLAGWSRAHVLAHLADVADGFARMTTDAVAGRATAMYPGGRAQRDADIGRGARLPPKELLDRVNGTAVDLAGLWRDITPSEWQTSVAEPEIGAMTLGRLIALRLTEVEVHHADLAVGFGPRDWSDDLTQGCLPLRVAALPRLRRRSDADHTLDGTWLLVCDDLHREWWIGARGANTEIETSGTRADAVLRGAAADLMAVLLGRQPVAMLAVAGDTARAQQFKWAFPGP